MTDSVSLKTSSIPTMVTRFGFFLLVVCMFSLGACGSTKVYTADKTIVYNSNLYNMSNVQRIGSRVEAYLPGDEVVDLRRLDKKGVEALIKEHDEIMVGAIVEMDQKEMVYRRVRVDRYSDYSKLTKKFDRAMSDIGKFMADKKKTQLKLK